MGSKKTQKRAQFEIILSVAGYITGYIAFYAVDDICRNYLRKTFNSTYVIHKYDVYLGPITRNFFIVGLHVADFFCNTSTAVMRDVSTKPMSDALENSESKDCNRLFFSRVYSVLHVPRTGFALSMGLHTYHRYSLQLVCTYNSGRPVTLLNPYLFALVS
jgi:hypothetical protein